LRLEKLAQFLIKTKLQNNKSNKEILLERANALFFILKIKNNKFYIEIGCFNSYIFMILILS